jgi:membrane AbrB-like protein
MEKINKLQANILVVLFSTLGGFLFSLTRLPIAWLLGSLLTAWLIGSFGPKWTNTLREKGITPFWRQTGQTILGIELGQNFKFSIIDIFKDHFIVIMIMLLFTIAISIFSGIVLWRFSSASMMTCLFGSTPGGISAMPAIAEETGANALVVSIIQTIRILLVVGIIPLLVGNIPHESGVSIPVIHQSAFTFHSVLWTILLIIGACGFAFIGKRIKMPAPWLIGSMLGVTLIQFILMFVSGDKAVAYWPHPLIIFAQIAIGTSIGSRVNTEMFKGLRRIFFISLISTLSIVLLTIILSAGISEATHIPLVTCILAFAPGGVAEMATTAIALHADSTFVLAVQSFRLFTILLLLPPLFRFINNRAVIHHRNGAGIIHGRNKF